VFLNAKDIFYGGIVVFSTAEASSHPDSLARSPTEEEEEEEDEEEAEEEEITA
jgi:ribosomal protein L12E/L44/L45/RPP1/RPP2